MVEWLTLFVLLSGTMLAAGEMRFVCPRPQSPSSTGMTRKPCGGSEDPADFDTDYTVVRPGPFTVRLEETVFRFGSPGRIRLLDFDSGNRSCLLMDYIPHNDAAKVDSSPGNCSVRDYPLGRCGSDSYITINIPDIECERCVLQFMSPDLWFSPAGWHCYLDVNCTGNYTCANIKIIPTPSGKGKSFESCQNYIDNLAGSWPYTTTSHFKVRLGGSPFVGGFMKFSKDRFNDLKYNISLGDVTVIPGQDQIFIVRKPSNEKLYSIPVTATKMSGFIGSFDAIPTGLLMNKSLAVQIRVISTGRDLSRDIQYDGYTDFSGRVGYGPRYAVHGVAYSPSGWLTDMEFVGISARYPQAVRPAGICATEFDQYAALLTDNTGTLRALIAYDVSYRERLHVDGLVVTPKGTAQYITFSTEGHGEKLTYPGEEINRGHAQAVLLLPGNTDPNIVEARIRIDDRYENITSKPFLSMNAVLTDKQDRFTALGVIRLVDNDKLHVIVVVLNKTADRRVDADVFIQGPKLREDETSAQPYPVPRTGDPDAGGWVGEITTKIEDSVIPHSLWLGMLSLVVVPVNGEPVSAQFGTMKEEICVSSNHLACGVSMLSTTGGPVDRGLSQVLPNGLATLYSPPDKDGILEYTLTVNDLRPRETVGGVFLAVGERIIPTVSDTWLAAPLGVEKAWTSRGSFNLTGLDSTVSENKIIVTTDLLPNNEIYGHILQDIFRWVKTSASKQPSEGAKLQSLNVYSTTMIGLGVLWASKTNFLCSPAS